MVLGIENPRRDPEPFYIVVDRPSLSVICDTYTGTILFIGGMNMIDSCRATCLFPLTPVLKPGRFSTSPTTGGRYPNVG
jgi:hypothetical protein